MSTESASRIVRDALDGTPQQFVWRHCLPDCRELEVDTRLNRVSLGGTRLLLAVVRDLRASKQEERFCARLIDSLPGSFFLYDANLRLRRWNKGVETRSGYTADDLRGRPLEELLCSEEDRRRVIPAAKRVLSQPGATDFVEASVRLKDGTCVPSLLSGAHVDSPDGPMLIGVGFDISARVRAEAAVAASERNYRILFDATNDALLVHDESGNVLDFNERASAMFGFDAAQGRRLTVGDLSSGEAPYSQREATEKIRRAVHEGPQVFEWQSRRMDGASFWSEVALRAFPIDGATRVIASVRDISERKRAAEERERLAAEVQSASSAKDQFLAVLSHELRNPLAAIQAGADLLRRTSANDARTLRALEVIQRNVRLQARLVDDLLDLSRLARGKLTIVRAPIELDNVVLSAVQSCRADAARAGVSLDARAEPGVVIEADADRIQQVVINLVDNGLKFTPKGGRVAVSVTTRDGRGQIVVEDSGMGIEPERLPELFEMFRQGQIAAQRAPGLGIGLALVKSIAELHRGRVWAESEGPGRGSRFVVELPLCEARVTRGAAEKPSLERRPLKMLLLEDNGDTRTLLSETFTRLAYQVVPAESAEAALEILSRETVDVILADIGLPGMDGYEFLREARRLPSATRTPAFALTGYGRETDVMRARDAGYVDHATKPLDIASIDQRIRSRLAHAAA